ncbi:hypothetical protein DFP73DRAFT_233235 [Morchella snyderi]|nr:hypothetical protein DFP73DRAFT_233235 [Morchella snyderi]
MTALRWPRISACAIRLSACARGKFCLAVTCNRREPQPQPQPRSGPSGPSCTLWHVGFCLFPRHTDRHRRISAGREARFPHTPFSTSTSTSTLYTATYTVLYLSTLTLTPTSRYSTFLLIYVSRVQYCSNT